VFLFSSPTSFPQWLNFCSSSLLPAHTTTCEREGERQ
jgi:hypothetical protein